ncbi:MAG: septal ring lytic transglycosylase RlpA family protein, partial [Gammaproteobacteria bacterium]|nr:septal ring lytic transglycosylase RlpA family protein [Gammaproteobacteria bacterium]
MQHRTHPTNWLSQLYLVFLFIIISSLNGCSTVNKDGPPPYDVDVSHIPNAQPKVEKLSKYGNMPVYRVNGKNYYVMNNSKHYQAEGIASWYGTKFHKKNTSSGEKYDMLGMTAAHRTLPLPTYLEVTNKANGRSVIVKVNDRGPFAENRLLDLSYAAAKKLGMIGHGTADVAVKAIDPVEYQHQHEEIHTDSFYIVRNQSNSSSDPSQTYFSNTPNPANTPNQSQLAENSIEKTHSISSISSAKTHSAFKAKQIAHYAKNNKSTKVIATRNNVYLQVGAFSNKSYAEKLKKQLAPIVASSVKITELGKPRKLYRVQIGP